MRFRPSLTLSRDPLSDRRLEWARGLLDRGDAAGAVGLLRETLVAAPDFLAGQFLLGEAAERAGDAAQAIAAFRRAADLEPDDRLGAQLRLARLAARPVEGAASQAYVRTLFDQFAPRFEHELLGALAYCGPAVLLDAVRRVAAAHAMPARFARVLDLGCGTGLMGAAVRESADELVGVDLSPAMIAAATAKKLYDDLIVGDLLRFLNDSETTFDLILAADVFIYRDDLGPVLRAARGRSRGLVAFSLERHAGEDVTVTEGLRFAHGETHLRRAAGAGGFDIVLLEAASIRTERGAPIPGWIVVLAPALSRGGK